MITSKMKKWLESLPKNPVKNVHYCVYMNRIQKRIERELNMLLWLAINRPAVFLGESDDRSQNERLKKLLLIIKGLNPNINVELVLKNLPEAPKHE